jgi:hypothetical protein
MLERKELGYLMVDNRASGGKLLEASTYTCTHCCAIVVLNPERKRERSKCVQCNHQICDNCGAAYFMTGECRSVKRITDQLLEKAARQRQAEGCSNIILP